MLTINNSKLFLQSGAIMAILAFVCVQYPDTELGIIFLPMLTFSAGAVSNFFTYLQMFCSANFEANLLKK